MKFNSNRSIKIHCNYKVSVFLWCKFLIPKRINTDRYKQILPNRNKVPRSPRVQSFKQKRPEILTETGEFQ